MKCVLITGGSRGIGRAICTKMAAMGYYALINFKANTEEANKTLQLVKDIGGDGELLQFDVADSGITANAVAPGFIKTDMTEGLDERDLRRNIPVNRFGLPEGVAHAVGFLASEGAGYITGEVLSVNGGLYT